MCQATPSPPSRWHYRASSSHRPARGWRGASSSWLGAALRVQASRLWDRRLSLPPPPLALITGVQAAARRARKGRAGASGAPAHACAGSAAEAWGWLVGLAVVAWAGECSQRGKLHEMASRSFHRDRLLPLPPPPRPKPGYLPLRTCAPAQLGGRALRPRISPPRGAQGVRTEASRARNARPWASEQRRPSPWPARGAPGTAGPALRTWRACTRCGGAAGVRDVRAARGMGDGGGLRTVSTTGYPGGNRLLGISTDPLGCPVAAELPSLLLIPVAATFPQRGEGCQGQGGQGAGGGAGGAGGGPLPARLGSMRGP